MSLVPNIAAGVILFLFLMIFVSITVKINSKDPSYYASEGTKFLAKFGNLFYLYFDF